MTRDMASYIDAYEQTVRSTIDVATTLSDEQWSRPTECPGWSVGDQVAHIVALEKQLLGEPLPPALDGYGEHVRNAQGRHMEDGIVAHRGALPTELTAQLATLLERRLVELRSGPLDPETEVTGVMGNQVPLGRMLPIRVFDLWAHEQDIRRAVGRPGNLDGPAAQVSRDQIVGALPYLVAKQAQAPAGSSVAFAVTGPLPVEATVRIDDSGRGSLVDGVDGDATVRLGMDWETLARLACGRVDPRAAGVTVGGDADLGHRVLGALAMTP